jgi:hypothetical protein
MIRIAPWSPRRRADIPPYLREQFEKYGEGLMLVVVLGFVLDHVVR